MPKVNLNKMKLLSLTFKLIPEKEGGFSVLCLDWKSVNTQGDTIYECKKNAIEATELMLEELMEGTLNKMSYPKIRTHTANPYYFQLTFDVETARHVKPSSIYKKARFQPLKKFAAVL